MSKKSISVIFVCAGNICRSPLAEGVFREKVKEAGLATIIQIASAGTGGWHVGESPDRRMIQTAQIHGVDISKQRAQKFVPAFFDAYDYIFAMDKANLNDIIYQDKEHHFSSKVMLFRKFDPIATTLEVPDPYYGDQRGFENVFEIVNRTTEKILAFLIQTHNLKLS